ncbi:APC family permease, partial [Salmonella enterica subsp. enterica serovar Infantis]
EDKHLGDPIGKLHPEWKTHAFALTVQSIIVKVLCFTTFISPSVAQAYWKITAIKTITYYIHYLVMFPEFCSLRKTQP